MVMLRHGLLLLVIPLILGTTSTWAQEKNKPKSRGALSADGKVASDVSPADLKRLAVQVQSALIADRLTGSQAITAKTDEQTVTLEGTVATEAERNRVSAVAARAAGKMAPLLANKVKVQAVEEAAKANTTGDAPQNAVPTALDKEQLAKLREVIGEAMPQAAKRINLVFRIDPIPVIVVEGALDTYDEKLELNRVIRKNYQGLSILNNVRVSVKPETPATAESAAATTRAPVVQAKSGIVVDESTPPADRQLAEKVALMLRQDKRMVDVAIAVQADQDVVWLRGSVQTNAQKVVAVNKADAVKDVSYVIDDLSVDPSPRGGREAEELAEEDVTSYIRGYFMRRVGINVVDVKAGTEGVVVILEDSFLDDQERQVAQQLVGQLEQELGRKITVQLQRQAASRR